MPVSKRPPAKTSTNKQGTSSMARDILGADLDDALDLFSVGRGDDPHPPVSEMAAAVNEPHVYSVSELSSDLRDTLRNSFGDIKIQGEVADFKGAHRSGHLYFSLKDDNAQIRAVMWKGQAAKVPFEIKQGLEVIVTGKLDYYGGSGSLQIVIEKMEPVGIGALQLKLEQLKEKLKAEGLFDTAKKRKVSPLNWRIGIVTSKTTAALQDMLRIYRSRFPMAEIFLFHAAVQGDKAPSEVVSAISKANRYSATASKPLDVLIITRGGGSYEDLFCFNDESIVRAIAASKIPTVSAIGHEIDVTLADFVADRRSATPSHAAQETVPEARLWLERLSELEDVFSNRMRDKISDERQRLDTLYNRLLAAAPQKKIQLQKDLLEHHRQHLLNKMEKALEKRRTQIARYASVLDALSPLKVLDRGYALVKNSENHIVRSIQNVKMGEKVTIRLSDGQMTAKIDSSPCTI